MDKIGAYTNTADASDEFTEGNPSTGTPATEVDGGWLNAVQRELVEVIQQMGLTLSDADDTLLWQAVQAIYGKTFAGNPNGNVAANVVRERCWDTSTAPPTLYIATAADGTTGGTTWIPPKANFKDQGKAFQFAEFNGGAGLFLDGIDGDFSGADYSSIRDTNDLLEIRKRGGLLKLSPDDGTVVGDPTGGAQGEGSLNVESLFVGGQSVSLVGALTPVAQAIANDDAAVEFTNIDDTYDSYILLIEGMVPASGGGQLILRTSSDNGVTYDSGSIDYAYVREARRPGAEGPSNKSNGVTSIVLADSINASAGAFTSLTMNLRHPSLTRYSGVDWIGSYTEATALSQITVVWGAGERQESAIVNAIQLSMSNGNISSGTFRLYGVKKS